MIQIGLDLIFSFFQLEKILYEYRILFYLPFYLVTLPTVAIGFYFVEIINPKAITLKVRYFFWSIPLLELTLMLYILFQFIIYEDDLWLNTHFYWTKYIYIIIVQGINIILGFLVAFTAYKFLKRKSQYLKNNNKWSGDVIKSIHWLHLFWIGYFIFHLLWSVLIFFDVIKIAGIDFYDNTLPYVYTFAALLTYWISFKSIELPKIVLSPWNPFDATLQNKTISDAILEKDHAVLITNPNNIILYASRKLLDILQYNYKELENNLVSSILHDDDQNNITNLNLLKHQDKPQKSEFIIIGKYELQYWCEVNAFISSDSQGTPTSFIFYFNNFRQLKSAKKEFSKYQETLKSKIERLLKEEKIHKDPNLTLELFASLLNISTRYTSSIIKELFDKNFRDLINESRVNEVKEMMANLDYKNYSLLSIGLEAGFNSKSTFHAAFKKYTGVTPMKYQLNTKAMN